MRPTPIDDDEVFEDGVRRTIAGPDGDLTGDIRPVDAIISAIDGRVAYSMRIALDDGDLARLTASPVFWLTIYARQLPPFALTVVDVEPEPHRPPAIVRTDAETITALLGERSALQAENAALRRERDHLARMLNPPPEPRDAQDHPWGQAPRP